MYSIHLLGLMVQNDYKFSHLTSRWAVGLSIGITGLLHKLMDLTSESGVHGTPIADAWSWGQNCPREVEDAAR
jgi:hypothetical protein